MRIRKKTLLKLAALCFAASFNFSTPNAECLPLKDIKLPPGFKIELYAANVPEARSLCLSPSGTLFVGTRERGVVYALPDINRDGKPDKVITIARGMKMPNGVAFRDGSLYVAEISRVVRFDDIENKLQNPGKPKIVNDGFPSDEAHGWKFIAFGPDGMLYIPVGAPCNICAPSDPRYETIMRMQKDGSKLEVFAKGVRNSVGFDWDPNSKQLWFTDNGRDWLGDDLPPDELNHAPEKWMNFGFPYFYGNNVKDPEFGTRAPHTNYTPPAMCLGAHVASLGMRFYTGKMFPPQYSGQIFIAEHGSWNRNRKSGYRITLVKVENNKAQSYDVFAEGWLQGQEAWGRPVDIQQMPDGSLLVSDDKAGAIYRITYEGGK